MKKILSVTLILLMLASLIFAVPFTASAANNSETTFTSGDFVYKILSDGTADIISHTDEFAECVNFPAEIDGYKVSHISMRDVTWSDYWSLTEVTIADGIEHIGMYAFYGCYGIESLTLPDSIKSIGKGAFWACTELAEINIPEGVTKIEEDTFFLCEDLKKITISDSITTIGGHAFEACMSLTEVTIPKSVTSIGVDAFFTCHDLKSIKIYNSDCIIGERSIPKTTKIYCYENSTAQTYAKSNGNPCVILDSLYMTGNVDDDGKITIKDATAIQKHVADVGPIADEYLKYADTDRDGKITVKDSTRIQKFLADIIPEL